MRQAPERGEIFEGDALELTVGNSPFAQGYGAADAPVCRLSARREA